jgi:hypothetical protein
MQLRLVDIATDLVGNLESQREKLDENLVWI